MLISEILKKLLKGNLDLAVLIVNTGYISSEFVLCDEIQIPTRIVEVLNRKHLFSCKIERNRVLIISYISSWWRNSFPNKTLLIKILYLTRYKIHLFPKISSGKVCLQFSFHQLGDIAGQPVDYGDSNYIP